MTTFTNKLTAARKAFEIAACEFREKRSEETRNAYMKIRKELAALEDKNQINILKQQVKDLNQFNKDLYSCIVELSAFKGKKFLYDGTESKQYKQLIQQVGQMYGVTISHRESGRGELLKIHRNSELTYEEYLYESETKKDLIDVIKEPEIVDFATVRRAREKHNKMLKQLERLQNDIKDNFHTATASGFLNGKEHSYF